MKKFFHQQKPRLKRQNFEDLQVSKNLRHHHPGTYSGTHPRIPSFLRELPQIMLAQLNIFQHTHGPKLTQ